MISNCFLFYYLMVTQCGKVRPIVHLDHLPSLPITRESLPNPRSQRWGCTHFQSGYLEEFSVLTRKEG